MKIAFISTMAASPWAGSEELWVAAAHEALRAGHSVSASVFAWPGIPLPPKIEELERAGARLFRRKRYALPSADELAIKVSNLLTGKVYSQRIELPAWLGALGSAGAAEILNEDSDVICVSQGWPYDLLEAPHSRTLLRKIQRGRRPYVLICHLNTDVVAQRDTVREEVREFYVGAQRVLFVSDHNWRATERQLAISLDRALVIRNPVNLADQSCVPWPADSSPIRMACVARLEVGQKGQDALFEALSEPGWRLERDWKLSLFGAGDDERYLRELVAHFDLGDRIEFCGYTADVRSIWTTHHLLVLPSRAEGTPLSLVEAILCGRPALVTNAGGNAEWVENGETGWVAEAATADSLRSALERAWVDRTRWRTMGTRAHELALSKLDPQPGRSLLRRLAEAAEARG